MPIRSSIRRELVPLLPWAGIPAQPGDRIGPWLMRPANGPTPLEDETKGLAFYHHHLWCNYVCDSMHRKKQSLPRTSCVLFVLALSRRQSARGHFEGKTGDGTSQRVYSGFNSTKIQLVLSGEDNRGTHAYVLRKIGYISVAKPLSRSSDH
jgi:hypothetical protein